MANPETLVFYWIAEHLQSPLLRSFMEYLTEKKNFFFPAGYVLVLVALGLGKRGAIFLLTAALMLAFSDGFTHYLIKPVFARERPCHVVDILRALPHCSNSFSFPSNHAVNAFTFATLSALCFPNSAGLGFLLASAVGFSRIYLGQHYPTDILAGAVCGIVFGYWGYRLNRFLQSRLLRQIGGGRESGARAGHIVPIERAAARRQAQMRKNL